MIHSRCRLPLVCRNVVYVGVYPTCVVISVEVKGNAVVVAKAAGFAFLHCVGCRVFFRPIRVRVSEHLEGVLRALSYKTKK